MAKLNKSESNTSMMAEVTEGTAVPPAAVTDYFQAKDDGMDIQGTQEMLERAIETSTLSASTPQLGIKGGTASFQTEIVGSGTEGSAPDYSIALESFLGTSHAITTNNTSKSSGNAQTVLEIEDADIAEFVVNDLVLVKESGEHRVHAVTAVDATGGAANITVSPGKSAGAFSNSVVVSKSITYKPSDTAQASYTFNRYHGNAVLEQVVGCRTTSFSMDNFTTGQIGSFSWSAQGMATINTASTVAPQTPTFSSALPAVFLGAKVFVGASEISVNEISLSGEQPVSQLKATGDSNGVVSQHLAQKRSITGSFPLYAENNDVSEFTDFNNGTTFSLLFYAGVPSSTAGELTMGSVMAVYLPSCIRTAVKYEDIDGIVTEMVEFKATGGVNGLNDEIAIGFI